MLELHVWGPAFGLPSLDPHCLAAIAYLQQAVPKGKWELVASSDPNLSPSNELPALRNGDIWIGGFRNIFHYIAQHSAGEWILDAGLPEQDGADCVAYSSFIEAHGQPLLDLSLFVSTANYTTVTRPLYNKIQSFPLPYLTPPALRTAAKNRTSHLNLSSLDIDSSADEPKHLQDQSIIPERLRRPRNTVSSLLAATPETGASIRLDGLARAFLEPLDELKRGKEYFVSDHQFTSLDCLVLGYLSLMVVPELPQPWLAKIIKEKFPILQKWTKEVGKELFGASVTLEDAFLINGAESGETRRNKRLPWKKPDNMGFIGVGSTFTAGFADSIPVIGQLRRNAKTEHYAVKSAPEEASTSVWQNLTIFGSLVAGFGLGLGYLFQQGVITFPTSEKSNEDSAQAFGEFGEAGAALSVLVGERDRERLLERNYSHGEPVVEVDVDADGGRVQTKEFVV